MCGGPVPEERLIQHLNGFRVSVLERPTQLTAKPIRHSINPSKKVLTSSYERSPNVHLLFLCSQKGFQITVHLLNGDAGEGKQFFCIGVRSIRLFVIHSSDSSLNNAFCALQARLMRYINVGSFRCNAEPRTLQERILFRMDGSDAMAVDDLTAYVDTVNVPDDRTVVTAGDNSFVTDNDAPHCESRAG